MAKIEFKRVMDNTEINILAQKAYEIWHEYFPGIITVQQIDYMLDMFLAPNSIQREMKEGYEFYLLYGDDVFVGFTVLKPEADRLFISKLYVDKKHRGQGYGSSMFEIANKIAVKNNLNTMYLTVNKYNTPAIEVYKHKGFEIINEVTTDIGSGFIMDDFVMEFRLSKREISMTYFKMGYNCSQAVALAFADEMEIESTIIKKIASSFGGGMGRLREVCGAVSGMFIVAGVIYGYDAPEMFKTKSEHYARIQKLAADFRNKNSSIVCRELLGVDGVQVPVPEKRTAQYYKKRPCAELVGDAAEIMEHMLNNH